ncbi:MAG: ribulose-phosphate 3-epimerase [Clostridiales bacterium]|jgi:ribulose-phosphate 3-epimerase|nr:ribulose-phosphate 3-epimerase [Clostridiales bacterium]
MHGKISPSMMCAPPDKVMEYIRAFERNDIEYLHIDVMDGSFVPNYALGIDYIKQLRKLTDIPLDIHLMINRPEEKLEWLDIRQNEYVSVHYESTAHIHRAVSRIREYGAKPMLAINPATPVNVIEYLANDIDAVLVMAVNPGFAGQKLIPQSLKKISDVKKLLISLGRPDIEIEVDGNVSFENAKKMREAGADIFVAGTSSIFNSAINTDDAAREFRKVIW